MRHIHIKGNVAVYTGTENIQPGDYVMLHTIDGDLLCVSEDMYPGFDCRGCEIYRRAAVCRCLCRHDEGYSRIVTLNEQMEEV